MPPIPGMCPQDVNTQQWAAFLSPSWLSMAHLPTPRSAGSDPLFVPAETHLVPEGFFQCTQSLFSLPDPFTESMTPFQTLHPPWSSFFLISFLFPIPYRFLVSTLCKPPSLSELTGMALKMTATSLTSYCEVTSVPRSSTAVPLAPGYHLVAH